MSGDLVTWNYGAKTAKRPKTSEKTLKKTLKKSKCKAFSICSRVSALQDIVLTRDAQLNHLVPLNERRISAEQMNSSAAF